MEAHFEQSNAFFHVLLEKVNEAVTGIDRDGKVIYWNQTAERLYGIPKQEILGQKIGTYFQRGSVMLFQVMETGHPLRQVYHVPRPGKHVLINAVPVRNESGELIGAMAIEQDITHTVKLSEELYANQDIPPELAELELPLFTRNSAVQSILSFVAQTPAPSTAILLAGEAGVGKNMLANILHKTSRQAGALVSINCQSLPSGLLETELFGYQIGLFGGVPEERPGKLDLAGDGMVYLKDLQAVPWGTQEKLLQALTERQFWRVGGTTPVPLHAQIVASTGPNVSQLVEQGLLHPDWLYRMHLLRVPALRERKEDLPELCHLYLAEAAKRLHVPAPRLTADVLAAVMTYHWPGNLTELRLAMEHSILHAKGSSITLDDLPPELRPATWNNLADDAMPLSTLSEEVERTKIVDALRKTSGNKASAARLLGISRGSLYYKMKQYGIESATPPIRSDSN